MTGFLFVQLRICRYAGAPFLTHLAMARRKILRYPDPRLNKIAAPVTVFDDKLRSLVGDMADTMYAMDGIGLAATQIDVHQRVIVMDMSEQQNALTVLINPEILRSGGSRTEEEGCLSVPEVGVRVKRAEWVEVRAVDTHGKSFTLRAEDWEAICIQHEMDHLQGIVFTEYLPPAQRKRLLAERS